MTSHPRKRAVTAGTPLLSIATQTTRIIRMLVRVQNHHGLKKPSNRAANSRNSPPLNRVNALEPGDAPGFSLQPPDHHVAIHEALPGNCFSSRNVYSFPHRETSIF